MTVIIEPLLVVITLGMRIIIHSEKTHADISGDASLKYIHMWEVEFSFGITVSPQGSIKQLYWSLSSNVQISIFSPSILKASHPRSLQTSFIHWKAPKQPLN